jgi:hypothetical protein
MTKFLTLKHWQLFVLLMGLPLVIQFVTIGSVFSDNVPSTLLFLFPVMMIVIIGLFFGWFYSLGTNLHKKLPPTATMSLIRFKIFLFVPVVYLFLISVFTIVMVTNPSTEWQPNPAIVAVVIPLHLLSMFSIFYCLYFIAKALKSVEWQKSVTFSDFVGEFFMIWFYPFGIWMLQPRINKLFDTSVDDDKNQLFENDNDQIIDRNLY